MSQLQRLERKQLWFQVTTLQRAYEAICQSQRILENEKKGILKQIADNLQKAQDIADKELIEEYEYLKANNI